ncbi:MAG: serine/threonine-protein kinase, partial [Chloroflexota bacterium]
MNGTHKTIDSRYRLMTRIGAGGMGEIYRVRDLMNGQDVALKRVTLSGEQLMFASRSENPDFKLALAQEFRMLSSLRHPHIISVINYGFDEEQLPYYTMDLLHNPSTLVEFARGLPLSAQIGLMVQVSQALAYLHRRGIIHRDLKPENVLVVDGTARVLDFGLAVQVSHMDQKLDDRLSGTLGYMAPEVLLGSPPGEKSDLYALGIMAYEIFYGEHPFDLSDPVRLIQYVIHTDIDLDGTLPPELRDIIE